MPHGVNERCARSPAGVRSLGWPGTSVAGTTSCRERRRPCASPAPGVTGAQPRLRRTHDARAGRAAALAARTRARRARRRAVDLAQDHERYAKVMIQEVPAPDGLPLIELVKTNGRPMLVCAASPAASTRTRTRRRRCSSRSRRCAFCRARCCTTAPRRSGAKPSRSCRATRGARSRTSSESSSTCRSRRRTTRVSRTTWTRSCARC